MGNFQVTVSPGGFEEGGFITPSGENGIVSGEAGRNETFNIEAFSAKTLPVHGLPWNGISNIVVDGVQVGITGSGLPLQESYTFTNLSGDHTISAIFEPLSGVYTVTVLPCVNGGSISPFGIPAAQMSQTGIVALQSGSSQFFNIEPTTDGTVQDVKVDGVSVGAVTDYLFENISDNHTISASFDDPV
jgi:hypothetical protein